MADITHQHIMLKLGEMEQKMATKADLNQLQTNMKQVQARLERKLDAHRSANTKHHLETRAEIGHLNRKVDSLRLALSHTADPID